MIYPEAKLLADCLVAAMAPYCERIEIAGSIRRKKPVVKDIEICAIAKREVRQDQGNLFLDSLDVDLLYQDWAKASARFRHVLVPLEPDWTDSESIKTWPMVAARVWWIKPGTKEGTPLVAWKVEPGGSYWRGLVWIGEQPEQEVDLNQPEELLPRHVKLDLFLTTREKWGVIFLLRTGSREFNLALIDRARKRNFPIDSGRIWNEGKAFETPEERDVFEALRLEYVEPELRKGKEAIRPKR